MKTERMRWKNWDAVRCVAGDCEMVVGVSAGPRILSLRRGASANLLYHDTTLCSDMGSFHIGGRLHEVKGGPVRN